MHRTSRPAELYAGLLNRDWGKFVLILFRPPWRHGGQRNSVVGGRYAGAYFSPAWRHAGQSRGEGRIDFESENRARVIPSAVASRRSGHVAISRPRSQRGQFYGIQSRQKADAPNCGNAPAYWAGTTDHKLRSWTPDIRLASGVDSAFIQARWRHRACAPFFYSVAPLAAGSFGRRLSAITV